MSVVVVLTDANVLYSRVLRDYFMYAARRRVIEIRWSQIILDEVSRGLIEREAMDATAASVLMLKMNAAQKRSLVTVEDQHYEQFADVPMPDPDDRHVVAAAVAAHADCLCTGNDKHFPAKVMERVGIGLTKPGPFLARLFAEYPEDMLWAHERRLRTLPTTDDAKTIETLRRAAGDEAADSLSRLLAVAGRDLPRPILTLPPLSAFTSPVGRAPARGASLNDVCGRYMPRARTTCASPRGHRDHCRSIPRRQV